MLSKRVSSWGRSLQEELRTGRWSQGGQQSLEGGRLVFLCWLQQHWPALLFQKLGSVHVGKERAPSKLPDSFVIPVQHNGAGWGSCKSTQQSVHQAPAPVGVAENVSSWTTVWAKPPGKTLSYHLAPLQNWILILQMKDFPTPEHTQKHASQWDGVEGADPQFNGRCRSGHAHLRIWIIMCCTNQSGGTIRAFSDSRPATHKLLIYTEFTLLITQVVWLVLCMMILFCFVF